MARKKMRNVIGVQRSPYASVGQTVELDVNDPQVAHYLGQNVLRDVSDVEEGEVIEPPSPPAEDSDQQVEGAGADSGPAKS